MKKLYIPTTTLNFNNILSSESISPAAFYDLRKFGYHRWFSVEENNNNNCVLLYEQLCAFVRPSNGFEDHPLVVEIQLNEETLQHYYDGVFYSDKTIYLNPWHTRFIFLSEGDMLTALSMSEGSLETKMVKLYRKLSKVEKPQDKYVLPPFKEIPLNNKEIEKDIKHNKMKGLLYGYYIGALLSSPKEYVERLTDLREIRNIFAAVVSHPDHDITNNQRERLDFLFEKIKAFEPEMINRRKEENKLYELLKNIAPEKDMDSFQPVYDFHFGSKEVRLSYDKYQLLYGLKSGGEKNPSLNWINNKINTLERQHNKTLLSPQEEEIKASNKEVIDTKVIKKEDGIQLFKKWCNCLFSLSKYNGKISTFNNDISDQITLMAKEIYQTNWNDDNPVRVFLNKLRRHIAGEGFDVKWDNNGLLYSVAAVLTNGDEWDKLLYFMQSKGMFDYRLAFAMYGELNGFANLTRDFTDILFECSSAYISEVYKDFYKQLFGKELEIIMDMPEIQSIQQSHPQQSNAEKKDECLAAIVDRIIKEHPRAKITERELTKINEQKVLPLTGEQFIKLIDNDMNISKTSGIFHFLQEELYPEYEYPKARKATKEKVYIEKQSSSTSETTTKIENLLFRYENINNIALAIQNQFKLKDNIVNTIKKDLDWVLNPQYNSNYNKTELIEKFRNQLNIGLTQQKSSKGADMEWKNKLYSTLDINAIIEFLKQKCNG